MFCCSKRQSHNGEIMNIICLEEECSRNKNQMCCITCLEEEHQGHKTSTIKKILPDLLIAHKEREKYHFKLDTLLSFIKDQFGEENQEGQIITVENVVDQALHLISSLKVQVDLNNEEMTKMRSIFKNLNKNSSPIINIGKSSIIHKNTTQSQYNSPPQRNKNSELYEIQTSEQLGYPAKLNLNSNIKTKSNIKLSSIGGNSNQTIDNFSHSNKHPYLTISSNLRTVTKTSHSGHRFAAISAKAFNLKENELKVHIDSCPSNNIMIGLCHESIIKGHQYSNCYGTGQGAYIIGQNSGDNLTAISFHHHLNVFNRKEIVGWNFEAGDSVIVGFNFEEEFIYFRLESTKKGKHQNGMEFSMKIQGQEQAKKEVDQLLQEEGLKFIVLLQNQGDQVTLIDS